MAEWSINPRVQQMAKCLRAGGVVAYPTEAVWGLAADPFSESAVNKILALKHRPQEKGVILLAANLTQIEFLLDALPLMARQELEAAWPGPVTFLIPHQGRVPKWISGEFSTVAVRVTDHPVAAALALAFGAPIVSTSCNPAGEPPARTLAEARTYFGDSFVGYAPGVVGNRINPSEIRDLLSHKVFRDG
ncbi:MAG: Sua5/YciO/YrdC/YwlC family protein [Cellvibrio sp.]